MEFIAALKELTFASIIDILLMAILIYAVLVWFKRKKAVFVLTGIIICGLIYLVAYQVNLFLITYVLQAFFAVILIAVIVIFRDELRDLFEQIAVWSIKRRRGGKGVTTVTDRNIETLVRTANDLAREKIGALIVLRGKNMIARRIEGGTDLGGEISEPLLKSLFDPNSAGHDGAVLIDEEKVRQFGCHLPLSKDFSQLKGRGTRHAAALGLAEVTDALCIVVSEETGNISVAYQGKLFDVRDSAQLTAMLEDFFEQMAPKPLGANWKEILKKNSWEKAIALGLAVSLWFVLVHESNLIHRTFSVPVEYVELTDGYHVDDIEPSEVEVTLWGQRNAFHFVNAKNIRLTLRLFDPRPGTQTVPLSKENLTIPKELTFEKVDPSLVRVTVTRDTPPDTEG